MKSCRATGRSRLQVYFNYGTIPFWSMHVAALLGVIWCGFSWSGVLLAAGMYYARMLLLSAGFHRYFSHRTYKTSRAFQLVLAVLGQTCTQKDALWWAANHRWHHRHSDGPEDLHSPRAGGFWWSHLGWFLDGRWKTTDLAAAADLARYPELRWLNRPSMQLMPAYVAAALLFILGGLPGFVWGALVSTVVLWHGTFTINSISHLYGYRRFETRDDSRNNPWLTLVTLGEGLHNNHHYSPGSANFGRRWFELDVTYQLLRLWEALGLIWDLRRV
ncbi:MAG TPA: fatty acid desaturase [Terriglobia bacterium]|nr:fatty acid desaturase [Terriglobia bacterium]